VRRFAAAGRRLAVCLPWRCHRCLGAARQWAERLGEPFLLEGRVSRPHGDQLGWRAECERSGGGALVAAGYDLVDLAVATAGVPDQVVALTGRSAARSRGLPLEVEDTALMLLKYDSGLAGTLTVSWAAGPADQRLRLHGSDAMIDAGARDARLIVADGSVTEARRGRADAWDRAWRQMVDQFAGSAGRPAPAGREDPILANMAVIEAAYLSARTNEPESPLRLFELHGID
jgi:predicted dehydrogenase